MASGFMQFATGALSGYNEHSANEYKRIADLDKHRLLMLERRREEFDKQHSEYANKINTANQAKKTLAGAGVDARVANKAVEMWLTTGEKKWLDPLVVTTSIKAEDVDDPKSFKPDAGEGETHTLVQPGQAAAYRAPPPTAPNVRGMFTGGTHMLPREVDEYQQSFEGRPTPQLENLPEPNRPYALRFNSPEMQDRALGRAMQATQAVVSMAKVFTALRQPDAALTMWTKLMGGKITNPALVPDFRFLMGGLASEGKDPVFQQRIAQTAGAVESFLVENGVPPDEAKRRGVMVAASNGIISIGPDLKPALKAEIPTQVKSAFNTALAEKTVGKDPTVPNAEAVYNDISANGAAALNRWQLDPATGWTRIDANARGQVELKRREAVGNAGVAAIQQGTDTPLTPDQQVTAADLARRGKTPTIGQDGVVRPEAKPSATAAGKANPEELYAALTNAGVDPKAAAVLKFNPAAAARAIQNIGQIDLKVLTAGRNAMTKAINDRFGIQAGMGTIPVTGQLGIRGLDENFNNTYSRMSARAEQNLIDALSNNKSNLGAINIHDLVRQSINQEAGPVIFEQVKEFNNLYKDNPSELWKKIEAFKKGIQDREFVKLLDNYLGAAINSGLLPKPGEVKK